MIHSAALLAAAALAIWGFGRLLDEPISRLFYDAGAGGFPLQHAWALEKLGHDALKWIMVAFWAACLVPRRLRRGATVMAVAAVTVVVLKHYSPYSCPWDLAQWGGSMPPPGPGRCLPAGHPVTGFMLFGLYFTSPAPIARKALIAAWVIGLVAGAVQVARGAHFASHVLWTAWVAWAVTLAAARLARRRA